MFFHRFVKTIMVPYMFTGSLVTLSYRLIIDIRRGHSDNRSLDRPYYFDHMLALGLIGSVWAGVWGVMPRYWFTGGFIGAMLVAPMSYWVCKHGRMNAQSRPMNMFYQDSVSKEEIERI